MNRRLLRPLALFLLALLPRPAVADTDSVAADEATLKAVGLPTDGSGLVEFFRLRSQTEIAPERIAALIQQFDAPQRADREKACVELIAIGPPALAQLRRAAKDVDAVDSSALARRCLTAIDGKSADLTSAAAHLLAVRRPAVAAETLLAFLPHAENENVLEEVKATLMTVAYRQGRPDAALLKALGDDLPLRRAVAVEVLCHDGIAEPRATLGKLLQDPVAAVRLQAGLALAQANEAEAVAVLIDIFSELPPDKARQVEEYLYTLAGDAGPKPIKGNDLATRKKQGDAWKAWWAANDSAAALAELQKRTLTDADRDNGLKLIARLGDDDFAKREKATEEVRAAGPKMLPLLRVAVKNPDAEISRRVRACLEALAKDKSTPLPMSVPRIVGIRKPPGAIEALLAYVAFADDEAVVEEVQVALIALAQTSAAPNAALVRALDDKIPARRAAAAVALSQTLTAEVLPKLHKLLQDKEPSVRLQTALGLAGARQREAVPVLIALLEEMPMDQSEAAEEYLLRLAGDHPPALPTGAGDLRAKRRKAWDAWWTAQGAAIALVDRVPSKAARFMNYTVLVQSQNGWVTELDRDGKTRWQITGLTQPMDAQVLPNNRVLIAEYGGRRVTERNFKGDILWEKRLGSWPISAQRLPNGHTFIVSQNQLLEVDRGGKEVLTYNRPFNDIMTAVKQRDGQIVCLTSQNTCFRLNADLKETKSFHVQQVCSYGNEVLPNGHVIVPVTWMNKVIEYDPDGKAVWEANVTQPLSAARLPNGNTLVSTQSWPSTMIELDKQGKQAAQTTVQVFVQRARKR